MSFLKSLFKPRTKPREELPLERLGINIYRDERIELRIKLISLVHTLLHHPERAEAVLRKVKEELELDTDDPMELVDYLLDSANLPWGRPSDRPEFAMAYGAWKQLYHWYVSTKKMYLDSGDKASLEQYRQLKLMTMTHFLPRGYKVMALAFLDKDVTPAQVTVVQQAVPVREVPYGGEFTAPARS